MDIDSPLGLRAVFELIDSAEVITLRFVTVPHRLLFDTRHAYMEGPLLRLVPHAANVPREMEFKERVEVYNAITSAGYHDLWVRAC